MKDALDELSKSVQSALKDIKTSDQLEELRISFFGRKGKLPDIMKALKDLNAEEKKEMGQYANEVKQELEKAFEEKKQVIASEELKERYENEWLDISAPGVKPLQGHLHLTTQAIDEISRIFARIGFVRVRHPEVDWDYYAFESLNMPKNHPARDEWETFFIADGEKVQTGEKGKVVLTPHTSNGQVREMERGRMPIRMININKTYRRQSDATHAPMFHQFEGLMVGENVTLTHLKGVFDFFVKNYFGEDRETRLRPYHFRFTEPSVELDITCAICKGTSKTKEGNKCRVCKDGWLELGGAGMTHPSVIKAGGLDPDKYSGFAFGWGVERTMMMRAGINIDDIRILYKNDLRFLKQF